jgi:uncharacterized protein YjdB
MTVVPHPKVFWSTSNPNVAAVSKDGRVTPKKDGRATITARAGTAESELPVVVRFLARLTATPTMLTLAPGEMASLTTELFDAEGTRMIGTVTFTSRDPTIATVDSEGNVTGRLFGQTLIDVSIKHLSTTIVVDVSPMNAS